ncbi:vacuolar protein sorting-associated protein 35-domain-containing protein [Chytridium lagenaria]|nr:vacuolar protein sorting-associated protein 35-domain-containing protein [Chytridium lagenaria]
MESWLRVFPSLIALTDVYGTPLFAKAFLALPPPLRQRIHFRCDSGPEEAYLSLLISLLGIENVESKTIIYSNALNRDRVKSIAATLSEEPHTDGARIFGIGTNFTNDVDSNGPSLDIVINCNMNASLKMPNLPPPGTPNVIPATGTSTPSAEDQGKVLEEALNIVKVQAFHMKRCLVRDNAKLMDALKHCSTMLAELRTSSLTPKNYYELYMAIFDELRHLTTYLYEAHTTKRHHLSDLYELVQYAGNIVPRLYLMITVGSVYMRVGREQVLEARNRAAAVTEGGETSEVVATKENEEEEVPPIKELMKDMLEMARGVQHPTRGLFLRYYLSGMTRDYLPDSVEDGPHGTISDSIQFILQNFIEMNKLWVRLQFQGHSREREKREKERKELRLLVGSNLVRLSQLDGLDLEIFRGYVLPKILEEIVSCKDIIAQEYLMEVIISDDFHLRTLDAFLQATARLHRNVNVKQTVISLIDRFAAYAARARDDADAKAKAAAVPGEPIKPTSGIPEDVPLFEVFWGQITELIQRLDQADQILGFAKEKMLEALSKKHRSYRTKPHLPFFNSSYPLSKPTKNPLILLSFPSSSTQSHPSPSWSASYTTPLKPAPQSLCGNYTDLLFLQPYMTRRQVAHAFAKGAVRSGAKIGSVDGVDAVFGESGGTGGWGERERGSVDWEDVCEEQNLVARLVHLVKADEPEEEFMLLAATRKHFGEGGDIRIRFTLPPLVMSSILLAHKYHATSMSDAALTVLYKFIHQTVLSLSRAQERYTEDDFEGYFLGGRVLESVGKGLLTPPDVGLRLFLMAAKSEKKKKGGVLVFMGFALTIYEEAISDSKSQTAAITLIIGTLYNTTIFGYENYETLITKCTVHCSRLLKRVDQCRLMTVASHLFWAGVEGGSGDEGGGSDEEAVRRVREMGGVVYRDGKKVLECLQKALKVADGSGGGDVEMFVEILEKYVWYFEKRNDAITVKYLNSLIDLIQTNLANVDGPSVVPSSQGHTRTSLFSAGGVGELMVAKRVPEGVVRHFGNLVEHLRRMQEEESGRGGGAGFGGGFGGGMGGRWGEIDVGGR